MSCFTFIRTPCAKDIFDFSCAFLGLVFLFPLFILVCLSIKLTSKGPVFYIAPRIGLNGKAFRMIKFRTMYLDADQQEEGSVTLKGDRRITHFGSFLRRWKLDELPELINILRGEMSLVGPRPDVSGFADELLGEQRRILRMKPGLTGPATLKYANEEEILVQVEDPVKYNEEVIYPDKVRINLRYMDNLSFWGDIVIIFRTIFRQITDK